MRVLSRKNKIIYKYENSNFSYDILVAIVLYVIAILLFLFSIIISYLFYGNAPSIIAGFGISSILFDIASMLNVILEIYFYKNFRKSIRIMLLLQIIFLIFWMFLL